MRGDSAATPHAARDSENAARGGVWDELTDSGHPNDKAPTPKDVLWFHQGSCCEGLSYPKVSSSQLVFSHRLLERNRLVMSFSRCRLSFAAVLLRSSSQNLNCCSTHPWASFRKAELPCARFFYLGLTVISKTKHAMIPIQEAMSIDRMGSTSQVAGGHE